MVQRCGVVSGLFLVNTKIFKFDETKMPALFSPSKTALMNARKRVTNGRDYFPTLWL